MILPGATLGILGGGQLGRMIAIVARRMGYRTIVLDPTPQCPAAQVADKHIQASVDDLKAAVELAKLCDVVTLEWELIPFDVLEAVERIKPLSPSSSVLRVIQDRLTQKEFLARNGIPQAPFAAVSDPEDLDDAADELGYPCILKRRRAGYDGKGQFRLASRFDHEGAMETLKAPCVLEAKINFKSEISVILARDAKGSVSFFPIAENVHRDGVLHVTAAPARVSAAIAGKAEALAAKIARALGHVGVMAVEMFALKDGRLLVNEIAPRVHNSGHYTQGACVTSQFEQHVRAVCGLALGETELLTPAIMVNLLGDLWIKGPPRWQTLLNRPNARLHLYGKAKPAAGRKMGHIVLLGEKAGSALKTANTILNDLAGR